MHVTGFHLPTDKYSDAHSYEAIYWNTLLAFHVQRTAKPLRLLEIGLGCHMPGGVGGSALLWRRLFPDMDLHIFEFDEKCSRDWEAKNKLLLAGSISVIRERPAICR